MNPILAHLIGDLPTTKGSEDHQDYPYDGLDPPSRKQNLQPVETHCSDGDTATDNGPKWLTVKT